MGLAHDKIGIAYIKKIYIANQEKDTALDHNVIRIDEKPRIACVTAILFRNGFIDSKTTRQISTHIYGHHENQPSLSIIYKVPNRRLIMKDIWMTFNYSELPRRFK